MSTTQPPCLINQSACGRKTGNPVCPKCGIDDRVVYPGQGDLEVALTAARAKYWEAHARQLEEAAKAKAAVPPPEQAGTPSTPTTEQAQPKTNPPPPPSAVPQAPSQKTGPAKAVIVMAIAALAACGWWWKTEQDTLGLDRIGRRTFVVHAFFVIMFLSIGGALVEVSKVTKVIIGQGALAFLAFPFLMIGIALLFSTAVQRLHDIGLKGAWAGLLLIPVLNFVFIIMLLALPSDTFKSR